MVYYIFGLYPIFKCYSSLLVVTFIYFNLILKLNKVDSNLSSAPFSKRLHVVLASVVQTVVQRTRLSGGETTRASRSATLADYTTSCTTSIGLRPCGKKEFRREKESQKMGPEALRSRKKNSGWNRSQNQSMGVTEKCFRI